MKWINKDESLPDWGQGVLIALNTGLITIGYRTKKNGSYDWQLFGDIDVSLVISEADYVTHWMPLPKLPSTSLPSSSVTGEEDKDVIPDEIYKDIADFFKYSKYRGPYTIQKYGGSMIVKFMDGSKAKCSIQMWQGEEVVLDDQPTTPVTGESEAIGFAEWLGNEDLKLYGEGWCQPGGSNGMHMSTSELYNLYKQSKK